MRLYVWSRATYDRGVLRGFETLAFRMLCHNFLGDRIATTMVPILDVLFRKCTVCGFLVSDFRVRLASQQ